VTIIRSGPVARAGAIGSRIALGAVMAAATLAMFAGPTAAVTPPAYNSIPTALPGNVHSVSFEATQTSEFGDYIALGGTERARANLPVTVVMSIWTCEAGGWTGTDCTTTPGDTFSQPLTLNMYTVDHSASVPAAGTKFLTTTQTFNLPYRPSWDPSGPCAANGNLHPWHSAVDGGCWNGLAHEVTFTLPAGADLPDELIWSISFNTRDYGPSPIGGPSGPYDSLNVGTQTFPDQPSYGTDVKPNAVFQNSLWNLQYGDGGATGTFRDDTAGWADLKPLACIGVACPVTGPIPTDSPSPADSVKGATSAPMESLLGETGTPRRVTPPPTSTGGGSDSGSGPTIALLICGAFGALALVAAAAQRRALRR
jgi:hypothetical protein